MGGQYFLPPLSTSLNRSFNECRWPVREERIRRVVSPKGEHLVFGGLEHLVIQKYIEHLIETRQDYAPQDAEGVWLKLLSTLTEPVPQHRYAEIVRVLQRFARDFRLDLEAVWKPEAKLAVDVDRKPVEWDDPSAFLRGILDLPLVRGWQAEIKDWKTAWVPLTVEELRQEFQAQTYGLLMNAWNPRVKAVDVSFHYVRWGRVVTTSYVVQDLDAAWARWLAAAPAIYEAYANPDDEKLWRPTPGHHCTSCNVAARCPLGIENIRSFVVSDAAQAEAAAEKILAAEQGLSSLREQLKAYVEAHGPLDLNGERFGFYPTNRWKWVNVPRLMKLAEEQFKLEPTTFLKPDTDAMKRLEKKNKPFLEKVDEEALRVNVGRPQFSHKKIGTPIDEDDE